MSVVIVWLHTGQFIVLYGVLNFVFGSFFSCSRYCWCSMVSVIVYSMVLSHVVQCCWYMPCLIIFMLVFLLVLMPFEEVFLDLLFVC